MAVNNQVSTRKVEEAGNYFYKILKDNWKVPEEKLRVDDTTFGLMAKEAVYAASLFLNPISRGIYSAYLQDQKNNTDMIPNYLQDQKINTDPIPSEKTCRHIITTVSTYSVGNREFPRPDIQELGDVCSSLVKCINAVEAGKGQKI